MEIPTGMAEPPPRPGVTDQLRTALAAAASYFQARVQLFGLEARDALSHYLKLAIFAAAALVALIFGYILLLVGLAFVIAHATGWQWQWVLLAMAGVHILGAAICGALAASYLGKPVLEDTLAEIKKDQAWLKTRTNKL